MNGIFKVVIVDDDPILRSLLRSTIDGVDEFEVVGEAENGLDAIRVVNELSPDLVILDVIMPVLDGLRALPKIVSAGSRVVMLTGILHEDIINRAGIRGATAFVDKANIVDDLAQAMWFAVTHRPFLSLVSERKFEQ